MLDYTAMYHGNTPLKRLYRGDTMIWEKQCSGLISELIASDYDADAKTWQDAVTGEVYHDSGSRIVGNGVAMNCALPTIQDMRNTGFTLYLKCYVGQVNYNWYQYMTADGTRDAAISIFEGKYNAIMTNFTNANGAYGEMEIYASQVADAVFRYDPESAQYQFKLSGASFQGTTLSFQDFPAAGGITWHLSRASEDGGFSAAVVRMRLYDACHSDEEIAQNLANF